MSPARRLLIGAIVLVTGVGGFATGRALFRPAERVVQPIAFNHQKHVEELEIDCDVCHEFYRTSQHSGLPTLATCLGCHEDPQTDLPEEQKVRDLAAAGEDDVFRKLFKMPDHVFYSHRRHVELAEIPCETCHGAIAASTAPPERPLLRVSMDFCLECHDDSDVSPDCTACHR